MLIDEIKQRMNLKGITQVQLANKMYVSNVSINRWMKGKVSPKLDYIEEIADILGCDIVLKVRESDE